MRREGVRTEVRQESGRRRQDYRAQADIAAGDSVSVDLSMLGQGKGEKKGKGKGKDNAIATEYFAGY